MATRVIVPSIPPCDIDPAHGPAYADARIPAVGSWGYLCHGCFHGHGAALGTGHGQLLILTGDAR